MVLGKPLHVAPAYGARTVLSCAHSRVVHAELVQARHQRGNLVHGLQANGAHKHFWQWDVLEPLTRWLRHERAWSVGAVGGVPVLWYDETTTTHD